MNHPISKRLFAAFILVLSCLMLESHGFSPKSAVSSSKHISRSKVVVFETESQDALEEAPKKVSLEEKMKSWEASEEELKAASLGGIIPQPRERTEAFDIGLYIAFPIMVLTGLAFAFFPFIMGNIDVSNIEVPRE